MTYEPDKAGKIRQSVAVALLAALLLLSAVAFLAGCKSSPSPTEPKVGYLYSDNDSVMFVEWEVMKGIRESMRYDEIEKLFEL
jgi:hypothetical protein